tara:strand:- start:1184 stop:2002 length:819 start_codon:yes stop_codon:yes gene_type:complete
MLIREVENEIGFGAAVDVEGITKSSYFMDEEEKSSLDSILILKQPFTVVRGSKECHYVYYDLIERPSYYYMTKEASSYWECLNKYEFETGFSDAPIGYSVRDSEDPRDYVLVVGDFAPAKKYYPHEEDTKLNECLVRQQREFKDAYESSEDFKELLNNLKVNRIKLVARPMTLKNKTISPGSTVLPERNIKSLIYGFNITKDREINIYFIHNKANNKCFVSTKDNFIDATENAGKEVKKILDKRKSIQNALESFNDFLQEGNQQEYPQCGKS